jgi:hypothetical protein
MLRDCVITPIDVHATISRTNEHEKYPCNVTS